MAQAQPQARHVFAQRIDQARVAGLARRERLRACLPELVAVLQRHGASRVVLFGSLTGERVHPDSDIDLAVSGVAAEDFFRAWGDVAMVAPARVDLVRLEDAAPTLAARIAAEGEVLHG